VSFGSFQPFGALLSRGRKAGSNGGLLAGKVDGADERETAFNGPFCAFWERIGKEGCEGAERGATWGVKTKKDDPC
jgi:hypothetical protein